MQIKFYPIFLSASGFLISASRMTEIPSSPIGFLERLHTQDKKVIEEEGKSKAIVCEVKGAGIYVSV